ncbi:MAG: SsrA-binding protein SmpB [Alphaproteobacteria bacterium]|nr:SsrA-binding protein SmpB [Alphaproteobacteria bacterium]
MSRKDQQKYIAQNRRARFDYIIKETFEAGLILKGSEVKSLREGHVSIQEAYATEINGAFYLVNATINIYKPANRFNHEPNAPRKLLLHKKQCSRLFGLIKREGITLVPMALYFNTRGLAKLELGIGKGKTKGDKRASEKEKDWQKVKGRALRNIED